MNHLFFASWFLQEHRNKKNEMTTGEEEKMEDTIWKANIVVTMATIKIKMVAIDKSVFILCVIFPAEIWPKLRSLKISSRFLWHVIKVGQNFKVKITFWVDSLKKHLEKKVFEGEREVPWSLTPYTSWPNKKLVPLYLKSVFWNVMVSRL